MNNLTTNIPYRLNESEDFMLFPTRVVTSLIQNQSMLDTVIEGLSAHGLDVSSFKVLHGETGRKIMDADGAESGTLGKFMRALENVSEVQRTYVKYVDEKIAEGYFALSVPVENEAQREQVAAVLKNAKAHFIVYFGRASIVDIQVPRDVAVL